MRSSIWQGSISFGLLNIPVTVQSAEESKELHFSMLDKDNISPIKYQKINAKTGRVVPPKRIVKGYQYKPGKYVLLSDADFKAANVKATQTIDIENFVNAADIDPLMFEKPYYLVPQKKGVKGYFLLHKALSKTKRIAIAKVVIRVRQHLCAIMTRGDYLILEILRFAHEVKEVHEVNYLDEVESKPKYSSQELKMAEALVQGMTTEWKPDKYRDTYYTDLLKRIKAKVKKGQSHELEVEPEEKPQKSVEGQLLDLMPLLKKSLESKTKGKSGGKSKRSAG